MFLRSQKTSNELDPSGDHCNASSEAADRILQADVRQESVGIAAQCTMNATIPSLQPSQAYTSGGHGDGFTANSFPDRNLSRNDVQRRCECQPNVSSIGLVPSINSYRLEEVATFLPLFWGRENEDINHFIAIADNTKRALGLDSQTMKLVVIKQLKGTARTWLHTRADFMLKSYEETLEDLRQTFGVSVNGFELRKRLEKIRWFGRESFADYCQSKKLIAQKLNLEEAELVEYIVEGIGDVILKNQARIQNFKTVTDIMQAFRMVRLDDRTFSKKPNVCYSCNQPGHFAANCRHFSGQKSVSTSTFRKPNYEIKRQLAANRPVINAVINDERSKDDFTDEGHNGLN
ncbi:uncharacterized protein LOC134221179 isoform X2 [Armigeres subalbatus]|uniref:uncharacterized protein LOC134221179 isoform X2 n=1 Tax=Armigeres subalbatus TaxID=124917 RepID=UPI002ED578F4